MAATVSGAGGRFCGEFLRDVHDQGADAAATSDYLTWAQGFISGYNWSNPDNADILIDHSGLGYWLLNYCGAHPKSRFHEALQDLIAHHR